MKKEIDEHEQEIQEIRARLWKALARIETLERGD